MIRKAQNRARSKRKKRISGHEIPKIRPSQRTVLATLVVAHYARFISFHSLSGSNERLESSQYAEINVKYCNLPVNYVRDLHIPNSLSFLTSHRYYKAARTVRGLAGDYQRADELCLLRANTEGSRALLDLHGLQGIHNNVVSYRNLCLDRSQTHRRRD
jgi:hypothetical protein